MWRVLVGLNETVTLSFLPVGHTKFAPDWCFGMLKQRYRRTVVGKLADIAEVVEQSSELNYHQLVGMQDGTTIVHTFDWQKFLIPKFNKVQQIKSYHNFRFINGMSFYKNKLSKKIIQQVPYSLVHGRTQRRKS